MHYCPKVITALLNVTNHRTWVKGDNIKVELSLSEQIAALMCYCVLFMVWANDNYMHTKYQHTPDTIYLVINDRGAL